MSEAQGVSTEALAEAERIMDSFNECSTGKRPVTDEEAEMPGGCRCMTELAKVLAGRDALQERVRALENYCDLALNAMSDEDDMEPDRHFAMALLRIALRPPEAPDAD